MNIRDAYQATRSRRLGGLSAWYVGVFFVVFVASMALFAELVDEVSEGETLAVDEMILRWFKSLHNPWLDQFMSVATDAGGIIGIVSLLTILLGILAYHRRFRAVWQLALGVFGAVGINLILKTIFARTRPDLWEQIVSESSYSFPSGHAMVSSAFALSAVLILWHTRWRRLVVGLAIAYVLFIGASRLYLGVHYPSDVLAGWAMSAGWVMIVAISIGTIRFGKHSIFNFFRK